MKYWFWILALLPLMGCSLLAGQSPAQSSFEEKPAMQDTQEAEPIQASIRLKDYGPAPEWHNETWLNTEEPLFLADLRGQVVLLEMWTFG
jgi:hypothetical protein